uniref:Uncharacterized protein n=1 Tax=viral metagenome TaxID=1070528 RepID=A0A6C0CGX9_9ZZZZ
MPQDKFWPSLPSPVPQKVIFSTILSHTVFHTSVKDGILTPDIVDCNKFGLVL